MQSMSAKKRHLEAKRLRELSNESQDREIERLEQEISGIFKTNLMKRIMLEVHHAVL